VGDGDEAVHSAGGTAVDVASRLIRRS